LAGLVLLFPFCARVSHVFCLDGEEKARQGADTLQRFYVVRQETTDVSPFRDDYILDVKAQGAGVTVRYVLIAPASSDCPHFVTVTAIETRLANASLDDLTGNVKLCSMQENEVNSAVADTKKTILVGHTTRYAIVAQCGQAERVFRLSYPPTDIGVLERKKPEITTLFNLDGQICKRAFGERDIFYYASPSRNAEPRHFGASLVPELRAGLYDLGFANEEQRESCAGLASCDLGLTRDLLKNYLGPDDKVVGARGTLINPEKYPLLKYVAPAYPPLAQMARIEGKVTLELTVDKASGSVTRVHLVSGHPLLAGAAEQAASQWKFQPSDTRLAQPIEVVLEFSFACTVVSVSK
jgi:TonB family protein